MSVVTHHNSPEDPLRHDRGLMTSMDRNALLLSYQSTPRVLPANLRIPANALYQPSHCSIFRLPLVSNTSLNLPNVLLTLVEVRV